jgi:16S rRNA (cytosine1402-N4)-methyltransferase
MLFSLFSSLSATGARHRNSVAMSDRMEYHIPVLTAEVLEALRPRPGRTLVDGTLGGGGHSALLLEAGARVIGLDQDGEALEEARKNLAEYGTSFVAVRSNFREAGRVLTELGVGPIDGVLLDLGVSSHQLDTAERGFSFQRNGPLDMRMDQRGTVTAADLLNTAPVEELVRIFRDYGEEPKAGRVAARIAQMRTRQPFQTTFDLVAAVESVIRRTGPRQPATRIFQALRMAVNDELGALEDALEDFLEVLAPGGRFAIITFHSLEDRMVKRFFRHRAQPEIDRPEWPEPRPNPDYCLRLVTPAPLVASPGEIATNPRARSAKLRVAEKLGKE